METECKEEDCRDESKTTAVLDESITKTPSSFTTFDLQGRELFNENAENVIVLDNTTNDQLPPVEDMDCQTKISPVNEGKTPSRMKYSKKERQRMKEEDMKDRAKKKAQKEAERLAKQKEKELKELERKLKKEREERERKEKQEKRETEKRKKQEEQQLKLDEKRKREEERKQEKEKEDNKTKMQSQQFLSFFQKKPSPKADTKDVMQVDATAFPPLAPKPGMHVAAARTHLRYDATALDEIMTTGGNDSFVSDFLQSCRKRKGVPTDPIYPQVTTPKTQEAMDIVDVSSNDCILVREDGVEELVTDNPRTLKYKLLQFADNTRPPYWGTWRKCSKRVTARHPFSKDEEVLSYEVDSDDEWEVEEQGESIASSENEEELAPDGEEDDDDGFFVPHGYLSEGEGEEDSDVETDQAGVKPGYEKSSEKYDLWEVESNRKCQPMKPVCIGCVWEGQTHPTSKSSDKSDLLSKFRAVLLVDGPVDPLKPLPPLHKTDPHGSTGGQVYKTPGGGVSAYQPVPEEALPDLIKMVHKSHFGLARLVRTFRIFWGKKKTEASLPLSDSTSPEGKENLDYETLSGISKRQLAAKIQQIAVKEARLPDPMKRFYVHEHVMQQAGTGKVQSLPTTPAPVNQEMDEGVRLEGSPLAMTPCKRNVSPPSCTLGGIVWEPDNRMEVGGSDPSAGGCGQESLVPPEKKQKIDSAEL